MGRRLFLRHVADATASSPCEISSIRSPEEGVIAFEFSYTRNLASKTCSIRLLAVDVDEYPDGNNYILFTEDEQIDPVIPKTLEIITPLLNGMSITDALSEISRVLTDSLTKGLAANPIQLDAEVEEQDSDFDDGFLDGENSDNDNFGLNEISTRPAATCTAAGKKPRASPSSSTVNIDKIKSDLRAAKNAGFRVGIIGDLVTGGVVTVSVRVTKLGLSEEAMQAWSLKRSHYLVLLIRFRQGYRELQQVKEDATFSDCTEMRVALCESYKPSDHVAYDAFDQTAQPKPFSGKAAPLEPLFIGRPLNDLFRERFAKIVSFRESCGFNWSSAEAFVNDVQGKALHQDGIDFGNYLLPDQSGDRALPSIVTDDTLDGKLLKAASLPLVAMQFLLRHFVRCTEFCLVCHCKVDDTFEALKPYVCSKPLCLYQYMALGFGPSIEWELLSQPYVVDLLVSFCYAAANEGRLKEVPVGIDLKVPMLPHYDNQLDFNSRGYNGSSDPNKNKENKNVGAYRTFKARIDFSRNEMIFEASQKKEVSALRAGDWFIARNVDKDYDHHYRVEETMFPIWRLSDPISSKIAVSNGPSHQFVNDPTPASSRPTTPPKIPRTGIVPVDCFSYNYSFDTMTKDQQSHAVTTLLDTLPSVLDMKEYLERHHTGKEPALKSWRSRISDSALNLLRWIIASNRSCIMQVDRLQGVADGNSTMLHTADARISGMDSWMQFRFAQGAPDKEQRFVDCVKKETEAVKSHLTLFAWHGSPLSNWHSIIRQGLRFDDIAHGRAYGHGVYMSNQASTSVGYAHMHYSGRGGTQWPNSALKISNAFSLQEVVNKPEAFVSKSPHYVVANIDWIQTRYLFVKSELRHTVGDNIGRQYEQDPNYLCYNESHKPIQIPITAVSKSRRPAISPTVTKNGAKKVKQYTTTDEETAEQQEDDANSVISDDGDREFFESDVEADDLMSIDGEDFYESRQASTPAPPSPSRKRGLDASNTDFVPGSLDVSSIKFLEAPKDGSIAASKALQKALKEALRIQESTPLSKLGWYINSEHTENLYQWICELHSFPEHLPLAKDMKKAGISSVVLETRFTNQYPFTPPFIRVVKPRFLPFSQGGGGNVTEGGALCMEMLTNSGWSAVTSIEMVLLQVRLQISDEERPARLANGGSSRFGGYGGRGDSYGIGEAVAAYERACRAHGWQIPDGFGKFAQEEFSQADKPLSLGFQGFSDA